MTPSSAVTSHDVAFCDGPAHTCVEVDGHPERNFAAPWDRMQARIVHHSRHMKSDAVQDLQEKMAGSGSAPPLRILVAEDDPDILDMLATTLTSHGMEVIRARHGGEALVALRAAARPPQLILLDLRMRGMDGQEFLAEQRADPTLAAIPVVIMTALGTAEQRATGLEVAAWISKPLRLADLYRTISSAASATGVDHVAHR